eukprot:TRINITY_DN38783_c0_g1_i1.p1 TRINITY_DN38783_c0_g1~~TRINITY_DN38783_c0_g1_i1.p1  ORF type:complete len:535 (-),score=95.57 TRINITY_DN38783_c0_g1_i1:76-1680(-)
MANGTAPSLPKKEEKEERSSRRRRDDGNTRFAASISGWCGSPFCAMGAMALARCDVCDCDGPVDKAEGEYGRKARLGAAPVYPAISEECSPDIAGAVALDASGKALPPTTFRSSRPMPDGALRRDSVSGIVRSALPLPPAPSNRPVMASLVWPCPSEHVLRAAAAVGFTALATSRPARELLYAAGQGCMIAARRALECDETQAWLCACDEAGDTALHHAARAGHLDIVCLLFHHGAPLDERNCLGESPLHAGCAAEHLHVVDYLCNAAANPMLGDLAGNEVPALRAVQRRVAWLRRHRGRGGNSAEELEPMEEDNCDKSKQVADAPWLEPVQQKVYRERRLRCVEVCLEAMQSANPGAPVAMSLLNSWSCTGLHVAAEACDVELCALLCRYSAAADAQELRAGATPLMRCLMAMPRESIAACELTVSLLLAGLASPLQSDQAGGLPLHYAVAAGDDGISVVEVLLRARAPVDAVDGRGASALAVAGMRGAPALVRYLLAAGARPTSCRAVLELMPQEPRSADGRSCREILEEVS